MINMTLRELNSTNTLKAIREGYIDGLKVITKDLEKRVIDYAPEKSGDLKRGIKSYVRNGKGIVKSNVKYSGFQEFGTMYMDATNLGIGYFRPAVQDIKAKVNGIMSVAIRKAFRRF